MLDAYGRVWNENCKNPDIYPVFGPFTKKNIDFDHNTLHSVMDQFILRIMDIVNEYDYAALNQCSNEWYRNFYQQFRENSDFFILNYDTTIEQSIGDYEDGFEPDGIQPIFKRFNPKNLLKKTRMYFNSKSFTWMHKLLLPII